MHNRNCKKAIVFALCLTMLMPLGSMAVSSANESEADSSAADTSAADTAAETDPVASDETSETEDTDTADREAADSEADAETTEDTEVTSDTDSAAESEDGEAEGGEEEIVPEITDEQAAALCEVLAENDNLILYGDEENSRVGLYVKATGAYWWSSPINAFADQTPVDGGQGDPMKEPKRLQASSSIAIKVADLRQEKRTEGSEDYSNAKTGGARMTWKKEAKGVAITYSYSSTGVTLTQHFELCDDNLYVYVDTDEIKEKNTSTVDGKVTTKIQICPYFGAAPAYEYGEAVEGYMIVPDGSGAVINYNNGKQNYPVYNQQVYGRDYTAVPLNAPRVTEQAYLPVMATVRGDKGIVAVASDGDSNVYCNARVSYQDSVVYNRAYFEFEVRSSDEFFMSGDSANKIKVFEKRGIKTPRVGVRYYPVGNGDGEEINYAECAEVYRNYLINEKGLTKNDNLDNDLYIDFFGGVIKRTSIVGLPFNLKTEITGFDQAGEIIEELKGGGVDTFTVNYNDWTNASIKGNISTKVKPSGTLGGKKDFDNFMNTSGVDAYPSLNNFTMKKSSWGYWTLTSTAVRISNAYSRQSEYSLAFGVQKKGVAPALLTPSKYQKTFDAMISSYSKKGLDTAGFGYFSSRLVSDFSKKNASSRYKTMNTIVDEYSKAKNEIGGIMADEANAYVLPYVAAVTNVPVSSSGYNLTDYDIPFYQMVLHGYIPYAGTAVNGSSNSDETFLLSLAYGSQIHYDLTYVDSDTLQDTEYNDLFYTNYKGWTDMAAKQFRKAEEVLEPIADYTITNFERSEDGNILTTTYSKEGAADVTVVIDQKAATATIDGGQPIDLGDCIEGGFEG